MQTSRLELRSVRKENHHAHHYHLDHAKKWLPLAGRRPFH
ncbi:Uncharacterised protein [Vibrio cholerae]|nr:Uncharacterised protein [Vibrio cholerae]